MSFMAYLGMLGVVLGIDVGLFSFTWARVYPPDDLFLPNTTHAYHMMTGSAKGLNSTDLFRVVDFVDFVSI